MNSIKCMLLTVVCMLIPYKGLAADYTIAMDKAKDAFLIQSGFQDMLNKFTQFGEKQARIYINKIGADKPAEIGAAMYYLYKNKTIPIRINNNNKIELHEDRINYIINL